MKNFLEKLLSFLRARSTVGGLEISDNAIRYACFKEGKLVRFNLRLPAGVIDKGQIKDRGQFLGALEDLRRQILGEKGKFRSGGRFWQLRSRSRINVVVSLSSVNIYTQVFNLPVVEGKNLEKAVQFNIQMISPSEFSENYSAWQLLDKDQKSVRFEVLSVFVNRLVVDGISKALKEAGFLPVAVESRAFSLARLIRERDPKFDFGKPYLVFSMDSIGIDILVLRRGNLYFQYFNSWTDIQGEEKKISLSQFEVAVTRDINKVVNFYNSHWSEPIQGVWVSTAQLGDEVKRILRDNFSLAAFDVSPQIGETVSPEWFVSLGAALRGLKPRNEDEEVSLLGISAKDEFRREQLLSFLRFWKLVVPLAFGVLIIVFLLADLFVLREGKKAAGVSFSGTDEQSKELSELEKKAAEFNQSVLMVKSLLDTRKPKSEFLGKVVAFANENGVSLTKIVFDGYDVQTQIFAVGKSEASILGFKKSMEDEKQFSNVDLPLARIQNVPDGLAFFLSFNISP